MGGATIYLTRGMGEPTYGLSLSLRVLVGHLRGLLGGRQLFPTRDSFTRHSGPYCGDSLAVCQFVTRPFHMRDTKGYPCQGRLGLACDTTIKQQITDSQERIWLVTCALNCWRPRGRDVATPRFLSRTKLGWLYTEDGLHSNALVQYCYKSFGRVS